MAPRFKQIVIIDDSELDRFVIRHLLERKRLGEEIVATSSASKALELLVPITKDIKANKALGRDICIFLDISMPFFDGKAFLGALRKISPELIEQVCVLSNLPFDEQKARIQSYGIKKYLKKPLKEADIDELF